MAEPILPDQLWSILQPLLPVHTPSPKGGRPRIDDRDRAALTGILFVLRTGIPCEYLPQELGCGAIPMPTKYKLIPLPPREERKRRAGMRERQNRLNICRQDHLI